MKKPIILKYLNYAEGYWYLWLHNTDEDAGKINIATTKENNSRKEGYQRPFCVVGQSEYILFTAQMICTILYSNKGHKLWNVVSNKRKKRGLSESTDYGW